jgi:fatty acid amide hydrolase 2
VIDHSGIRLAALIRERRVTSREVVEAHIARIEAANPRINAVVRDRFDRARAEADRADREPSPRPFHGVPCTIKECFALEGMPNSSGLWSRRDVVSTRDAPAVARLRAAGAIPLGVTNVPELCMWLETDNRVYGRTKNPYDRRRIAGGSSGGEGAIVAAGGSPFGLGSDIAGSIRLPAFFCGVFGHKPTPGLVPNDGQFPLAANEGLRYLCTGPIARRAEDLWPLLKVLAGDLHGDPAQVSLHGLPVLDVEGNGIALPTRDLRDAQRLAARRLESLGASVRPTVVPGFERSFEVFSSMLSATGATPYAELAGIRAIPELLRWLEGRSRHTLPAIWLAGIEEIVKRRRSLVAEGRALRERVVGMLGDGVMLLPVYPEPAPLHGRPLLAPRKAAYTAIVNVLELPATAVPLGLNADGLPLGLQVVAGPGRDHVSIAVALELERAFGGWRPPYST